MCAQERCALSEVFRKAVVRRGAWGTRGSAIGNVPWTAKTAL